NAHGSIEAAAKKHSVQRGDGSSDSAQLLFLWPENAVQAGDGLDAEQSHRAEAEPMRAGGDDRHIGPEPPRQKSHANARDDLADVKPKAARAGKRNRPMLE